MDKSILKQQTIKTEGRRDMKKKTVAIIQTRMSSTRLPGKVLLEICGKPVLEHVVDRISQCSEIDEIVIATTDDEGDRIIVEKAKELNCGYFTGDRDDVLSRYYHAAQNCKADIIMRITSDCPLIDTEVTNNIVRFYKEHDYDFVANLVNPDVTTRSYPDGLDTEVFSFAILEEAFLKSDKRYYREHVTMYMHDNIKNKYCYRNDADYSKYRWTLDTQEDFDFIANIYKNLYKPDRIFSWMEAIRFIEENPELADINGHIVPKEIRA